MGKKVTFIGMLRDRELSLRLLARKIGVHYTYLSHMANGRRMPTLERAMVISKALRITPEQLFKVLPKEIKKHGRPRPQRRAAA